MCPVKSSTKPIREAIALLPNGCCVAHSARARFDPVELGSAPRPSPITKPFPKARLGALTDVASKMRPRLSGPFSKRTTGFEPATLSLGSASVCRQASPPARH